jgi:TonB family protein
MKVLRVLVVMTLLAAVGASPAQTPTPAPDSAPHDAPASTDHPAKGAVSQASCYDTPMPPYTKEARKAGFEGTITVKGKMTVDGALADMKIVNPPGLGLDDSILKTLKKWKCKPATDNNGKPVEKKVQFVVNFALKR